jgi:hypothetical protein
MLLFFTQVLGRKGSKQAGTPAKVIAKHITFVATANTAGEFIMPLFITPGKFMKPENYKPWESAYVALTENGSMEKDIFAAYAELFVKLTKSSPERPSLLLLDNHGSHHDLEALETFAKHGVTLLALPPNTTSVLCPLDVSFFRSLKRSFHEELGDLMDYRGSMSLFTIIKLFRKAFESATRVTFDQTTGERHANIISGFRKCGIHPFNREAISRDLLAESDSDDDEQAPPAALVPRAIPEMAPGSPQVKACIVEALEKLKGDRPVRKYAKLGGSKILTSEEFRLQQAQKILAGAAPKPKKGKNRAADAALAGDEPENAGEDNPRLQAYLTFIKDNNGQRPPGRPPKGFIEPEKVGAKRKRSAGASKKPKKRKGLLTVDTTDDESE